MNVYSINLSGGCIRYSGIDMANKKFDYCIIDREFRIIKREMLIKNMCGVREFVIIKNYGNIKIGMESTNIYHENLYNYLINNDRNIILLNSMDTRLMNILHKYIEKQTPNDNGDIESFHNSLKTDYIWQNNLESYENTKELMEHAFNYYNNYRPHSSIGYLTPVEFEKQWNSGTEFRNKFLEARKKKEERRLKSRKINISRRNESVSILY